MKALFSAIVGLLFLASCSRQENPPQQTDFESLMGKGLSCWQYVETKEDLENIRFYKDLFAKMADPSKQAVGKIPKVLHFIWLGPKTFPSHSVQNVKSWIAKHPDWKVKFWTDRKRPLPHPSMEMHLVQDFPFERLQSFFYKTSNYGEKSDLLRYEILFQEGGVYVDHDVHCLQSFNEIHKKYDFYCGLDLPSETVLSSSVHATNNLIASMAHHPILDHAISWLTIHWNDIEAQYPGEDKEALINRVAHRTFTSFAEAVRYFAGKEHRDAIFPAFYFNAPDEKRAVYARHEYAGTWFENETPFEKMARERLMLLSKKANKILLFCGVFTGLNVLGFIFLAYCFLRKNKRAQDAA